MAVGNLNHNWYDLFIEQFHFLFTFYLNRNVNRHFNFLYFLYNLLTWHRFFNNHLNCNLFVGYVVDKSVDEFGFCLNDRNFNNLLDLNQLFNFNNPIDNFFNNLWYCYDSLHNSWNHDDLLDNLLDLHNFRHLDQLLHDFVNADSFNLDFLLDHRDQYRFLYCNCHHLWHLLDMMNVLFNFSYFNFLHDFGYLDWHFSNHFLLNTLNHQFGDLHLHFYDLFSIKWNLYNFLDFLDYFPHDLYGLLNNLLHDNRNLSLNNFVSEYLNFLDDLLDSNNLYNFLDQHLYFYNYFFDNLDWHNLLNNQLHSLPFGLYVVFNHPNLSILRNQYNFLNNLLHLDNLRFYDDHRYCFFNLNWHLLDLLNECTDFSEPLYLDFADFCLYNDMWNRFSDNYFPLLNQWNLNNLLFFYHFWYFPYDFHWNLSDYLDISALNLFFFNYYNFFHLDRYMFNDFDRVRGGLFNKDKFLLHDHILHLTLNLHDFGDLNHFFYNFLNNPVDLAHTGCRWLIESEKFLERLKTIQVCR